MASLVKVGNTYNIPAQQYCCDTMKEFREVFENDTTIPDGSEVIILDSEVVKVKGPSSWIDRPGGGGGGTEYPWARD